MADEDRPRILARGASGLAQPEAQQQVRRQRQLRDADLAVAVEVPALLEAVGGQLGAVETDQADAQLPLVLVERAVAVVVELRQQVGARVQLLARQALLRAGREGRQEALARERGRQAPAEVLARG